MLLEMFSSVIAGAIAGAWVASHVYSKHLAAYRAALNDAQCELAAAEKQINAQQQIYNRFEQRLTHQFSRPHEHEIEEESTHQPIVMLSQEPKAVTIRRDGVLTYEVM